MSKVSEIIIEWSRIIHKPVSQLSETNAVLQGDNFVSGL